MGKIKENRQKYHCLCGSLDLHLVHIERPDAYKKIATLISTILWKYKRTLSRGHIG